MKLKKDDFLDMLQDADVQREIIRIVNADEKKTVTAANTTRSENDYEALHAAYQKKCADYANALQKYRTLNAERDTWADALQRKKEEWEHLRTSLEQKNAALFQEGSAWKAKCLSVQEELTLLRNQMQTLKTEQKQLLDKNAELEAKQQMTENSYGELDTVYNSYMTLSAEVRSYFSTILCDGSAVQFLASGSQWRNIETLWQNIKYKLDSYSEKEIDVLTAVFKWLFGIYNTCSPTYILLSASEGERFDGDIHAKTAGSAVAGVITQVLLPGYKNQITGKVIEKSVVRVRT